MSDNVVPALAAATALNGLTIALVMFDRPGLAIASIAATILLIIWSLARTFDLFAYPPKDPRP